MALHPKAQRIAPCVVYEVEMFFKGIERLALCRGHDDFQDNQQLESILLHARNIYDFLFVPAKPDRPDVWAQHFFDDPSQWSADPRESCAYLVAQRERLNRSIQHLSYDRLDYADNKDWDVHAMALEIKKAWSSFLDSLMPARRRWFAPPSQSDKLSYTVPHPLCLSTSSSISNVRVLRPI